MGKAGADSATTTADAREREGQLDIQVAYSCYEYYWGLWCCVGEFCRARNRQRSFQTADTLDLVLGSSFMMTASMPAQTAECDGKEMILTV